MIPNLIQMLIKMRMNICQHLKLLKINLKYKKSMNMYKRYKIQKISRRNKMLLQNKVNLKVKKDNNSQTNHRIKNMSKKIISRIKAFNFQI